MELWKAYQKVWITKETATKNKKIKKQLQYNAVNTERGKNKMLIFWFKQQSECVSVVPLCSCVRGPAVKDKYLISPGDVITKLILIWKSVHVAAIFLV